MNNDNNTEPVLYAVGARGYSAYEVAVQNGFIGTEQEWLDSLDGDSAYQVAVEQGYEGTKDEWLASLIGPQGPQGKSAYQVAVENGYEGTEEEWVDDFLSPAGYVSKKQIVDDLDTNDATKVLSAKQGKVLKGDITAVDIKADANTASISTETSQRISNDTSLQNLINSLSSGSPADVYDTYANLTTADPDHDKIYVVTADGKWYYYSQSLSQWTEGGTYQSSEISDDSIKLSNLKEDVIKQRYDNITNNVLNPFDCRDNCAIASADGSISTNSAYWITNKIYLNADDDLHFYMEKDGRYTHTNPYKMAVYDIDDSFIEATTSLSNNYVATQNCYVILQYKKEYSSFEDRFARGAVIFTDEQPWVNSMRYPWYKNTSSKKNNINLNIISNDLSDDLKGRLSLVEEPNFELGTYNASDGLMQVNNLRIRTKIYIYATKGTIIRSLNDDVETTVLYYNNDNGYITYSDTTGFAKKHKVDRDGYINVAVRYTDNRVLVDADIPVLVSKIEILSPVKGILEYVEEHSNDGRELEYKGEKIELHNKCYVSSNLGISTANQDGCVYDKYNFEFGTNGTFKVQDLETNSVIGTFDLDQKGIINPHCNSACFGNEFYDVSDDFPLLYINAYNTVGLPLGTCYVHRIQKDGNDVFTTTLVQTITIGFTDNNIWADSSDIRPYGNFAVDVDHNYLYAFTMRTGLNVTRFFKFNLPKLSDGETVTLQQTDILEYFDTPYENYIQGCQYYQNKIFSACGINTIVPNSSSIRVIDLVSKGEIANINTTSICNEPETIAVYNHKLLFGESDLLYVEFE